MVLAHTTSFWKLECKGSHLFRVPLGHVRSIHLHNNRCGMRVYKDSQQFHVVVQLGHALHMDQFHTIRCELIQCIHNLLQMVQLGRDLRTDMLSLVDLHVSL